MRERLVCDTEQIILVCEMVYTITKIESLPEVGSVTREVYFAFAVSLPFLTLGIETALCEPFNDAFIFNNMLMEWYQAALLVVAAAAAPVFAWLSQGWGRKVGYYCICLIQGLVFIPVFVSTHDSLPYSYILIGLSSGGIFTVLPPYIKELTSKTRGVSLTLAAVMLGAGYQLRVLVKEYYETMSYLVLGLVALQMMLMMVIVESPGWLVMAGKRERAISALSSLRRLPEGNVNISKEIDRLTDEACRGIDGRMTLLSLYRNKIHWDIIKMGFLLYTTVELCGSLVFLDTKNACDCFVGLRDPNVIVAFALAGSVLAVVLVWFWDRKYILTLGYTAMALSLGVYAVFNQIHSPGVVSRAVEVTTSLALPVVLLAYGMTNCLPSVVLVDMLNIRICTPILATLFTYSQLLMLLQAHTFHYLEEYVGIQALFYIYAGINLYGGVYSLFVVPNIRNKSLKDIEKQVKRIPLPA